MPRLTLRSYLRDTFGCEDPRTFALCGMDEVGRGAYAGPLVAAAVVLPHGFRHPLLRDSKLLSAKQRNEVVVAIRRRALALQIEEISTAEINARGMGWANTEIFRRLAAAVDADGYCCDGNLRIPGERRVHTLVAADRYIPAVSAASIVAKVHRDAIMVGMHDDAPVYNWASNKGYGAAVHRDAIRNHGPHREHRTVWVSNLMQMDLQLDTAPQLVAAAG
jgi:ribonuclease HII